jgi:hypothetical protein
MPARGDLPGLQVPETWIPDPGLRSCLSQNIDWAEL